MIEPAIRRSTRAIALGLMAMALGTPLGVELIATRQSAPTPQERVAALKQSLQESQAQIRKFEWIETTVISLKGEEKARTQKRVYYGADGTLEKLAMGNAAPAAPQPAAGRGGRGGRVKAKVVESKKDEMKEYMERATALIHQYVPPKPADIQRAKDGGKMTVTPAGDGRVRLDFPDYLKPGDRLSIEIDGAKNRLLGVHVTSYLDKAEDAVELTARLGALNDGTGYTAQTTLDAAAKKIRVVIDNAGHRPLAR
jgi:hypothetical protein